MRGGVIFNGDDIIVPENYEQKSQMVIQKLDEMLLGNITEEDSYDEESTQFGFKKKYKKTDKTSIMPTLTQVQVSVALNRILRVFRPLNETEAREISDLDYLQAFGYYNDIIFHINKYIVFIPDKQTFCAFVNITDDIYNTFLNDPNYSQVFKGFEDSFIHSNFTASQAGIADSKTILTKLQTKDAGHNLVKNPEAITFNNSFIIDKEQANLKLQQFESMIKKVGYGKPHEK